MQQYCIDKADWDKSLEQILVLYDVFASVDTGTGQDYEPLSAALIPHVVYNTPKPSTPLRQFFLPFREEVSDSGGETAGYEQEPDSGLSGSVDRADRVTHLAGKGRTMLPDPGMRVIMGIPNCDLEGLGILDEIFLDPAFPDPFYTKKRRHTLLITADCFSVQEHCHCSAYGLLPYADGKGDISIALMNNQMILSVLTGKGESFLRTFPGFNATKKPDTGLLEQRDLMRSHTLKTLETANRELPDYRTTGHLIRLDGDTIWKKYSANCVSCGACSAICPTCSCFLLTDKPGFRKIKQLDTCQYPGFQRVAGGGDPLNRLFIRFRNRYFCKYVWKPEKFNAIACTGCGRCIEACIGKINKNELFIELNRSNPCT